MDPLESFEPARARPYATPVGACLHGRYSLVKGLLRADLTASAALLRDDISGQESCQDPQSQRREWSDAIYNAYRLRRNPVSTACAQGGSMVGGNAGYKKVATPPPLAFYEKFGAKTDGMQSMRGR